MTDRAAAPVSQGQQVRDRFPDLLRSLALGAVILGHWVMGAVAVGPDRIMTVDNVLNINRFLWPITWVLVLIPLFFFVGGFSNATSLTRAHARGTGSGAWVGRRVSGLLIPVLPFIGVVVAAAGLALLLGAPTGLTLTIAVVVVMPLWFVAVYGGLAALTPALFALHRRFGWRVVLALAVLAVIVDLLRTALNQPLIGWLNYVFVHATSQQLGFFYFDGRLSKLPMPALLSWATLALGCLAATVATSTYAESMVGLSGERSNMSPPGIPSLLHGLVLIPLAMAALPWLKTWIDKPKAAQVLDIAAHYSMRAFLWHLPVLVIVYGLLYVAHVPFPTPGTGAWWATRLLLLPILGVSLWGWLAAGDRFRGRGRRLTPD